MIARLPALVPDSDFVSAGQHHDLMTVKSISRAPPPPPSPLGGIAGLAAYAFTVLGI
jgi:hypothetical protein